MKCKIKKIILFFLEKSRVVNIFETYSNKAKNIDIQFKDNCIKIECTKFKKNKEKIYEKKFIVINIGNFGSMSVRV